MARATPMKKDSNARIRVAEFPSPFIFNEREPVTLVELRMRAFSGKIRSKPNWWEKISDAAIAARWRDEMVEQDRSLVEKLWGGEQRFNDGNGSKQWPRDPITDTQLDYVFDELKYQATQRDEETGIFATSIYKVHESRSLIQSTLKDELIKAVSLLEDVPNEEKDWHPGANKQVLDLVHPSLYCLRIGESYVRKENPTDTGAVEIITEENYNLQRPDLDRYRDVWRQYAISSRHQWLPTDFAVSEEGGVEAVGYINNIHPTRHRALYPPITSILARFIPLFERVLEDALSPEPPLAVKVNALWWYDMEKPPYENEAQYEAWYNEHRWPVIPDPAPFSPPDEGERVEYPLRGDTIQVIVKLANIILTPDNPKYAGGAWHVEGMANENIVATGLYYYACENITESRLDFRAVVGCEDSRSNMRYLQDDQRGYVTAYGIGRGNSLNQCLGHIVAEEGKCIAFPNEYQHHVDEFELADPSKPGYRKILCFFLVDPEHRILSTADVPPQQEDWVVEEVGKVPAMQNLPVELFDMVGDYVKAGAMSRKRGEEVREELMNERSHFVMEHNDAVFEVEFNMCEH